MLFFYFTYAYVGGVLLLFVNFFLQTYILRKPKSRNKTKAA
jgi:hypothetical protein